MATQIQYDFFQPHDEMQEINVRIDDQKDALRRTQRKFFAQNKELMALVLQQNKQIEDLNNRLNALIREV